jgi:putative FmdB family regulatory protein
MPKYDYRCQGCYSRYEIEHSMTEEPIVLCNECGYRCKKIIMPVPIRYAASGFYSTDKGDKNDR